MELLNGHPLCEGIWTREENGSKSIIDYAIINKEEIESLEKMTIDEGKQVTPATEHGTFTDHNSIIVELNWITTSIKEDNSMICLTQRGQRKLTEETMGSGLTKIWKEKISIQEKYTKWSKKVVEIAENIFTTKKKRNKINSRKIRKLQQKKKN